MIAGSISTIATGTAGIGTLTEIGTVVRFIVGSGGHIFPGDKQRNDPLGPRKEIAV
jgi:hypothetical protein